MVDKNFCISSFLAFRYVIDDDRDFFDGVKHRIYELIPSEKRVLVDDEYDVDRELKRQLESIKHKKIGLLLSGGMDSACLAPYLIGCEAYTFRFLNGEYQKEELNRAETFARKYDLNLHYVDIDWSTVETNLPHVIASKGAPVHSIEPQVYQAACQAKADGVEVMVIGDAADYVFGGMDGLHSKDWSFEEFVERYVYLDPREVVKSPVNIGFAFEEYRIGKNIDFIEFMHKYADIESYASYENAFAAADMEYVDPYEVLKLSSPLDLNRIRNGESKYVIRNLFKMKYPSIPVPEKNPMPRPVDKFFENWNGPVRSEFLPNIDLSKLTGNQKWQLYCLEYFLNLYDGSM